MAKQSSKVTVKSENKGVEPVKQEHNPLVSLRREIDRLFDDFSSGFSLWPFGRHSTAEPTWRLPTVFGMTTPATDVVETENEFQITAELPGMDEKDIELTLSDDLLTIKGEKSEEREEKEKDYYLSERRFGSFRRSFRLPEGVNADKISAEFSKGVLTITLPKTLEAKKKAKKIAVKAK